MNIQLFSRAKHMQYRSIACGLCLKALQRAACNTAGIKMDIG